MKTLNFKSFLLSSLFLTTTFSCVDDDFGTVDTDQCESIPVTKTVQDITSTATAAYKKWATDDVIEAYVTSSDEAGNFYKSISFMSVDGTIGFSMPIDQYNLYTYYEPGRKVFVKMKDLYYATDNSSTIIGSLFNNDTPDNSTDDKVGRISRISYDKVLRRSCDKVDENTIVKKNLTIAQAKNNQYINMLVEFDAVQFTDASLGKKYYDTTLNSIGGATNHEIIDVAGNRIVLRVSEFADFNTKMVPDKNGKIRGVITKFGSTFQFMIRTENDVMLTNPRIDLAPALVGTNLTYTGAFTETFETGYAVNQTNFPKYINDVLLGYRYWQLKTSGGNEFIESTSFGSGGTSTGTKSYFFVPVDFTAANSFTFKESMRFNQGVALQVYYVSAANYTPGNAFSTSDFTNITSNFTTISYPALGASESTFNSAGTYNIPVGLTGNGYFVFEYSGTSTLTTTVQIDDIVVN